MFFDLAYAGSGLSEGPFSENNIHPFNFGFKMGFCQSTEMGPRVGKKWVLSDKCVKC